MLKILQLIFSIMTIVLASYGLMTQDFQLGAYMILFLGLTMLVIGLQQLKNYNKTIGWMLVAIAAYSVFIAAQSFVLHYG